MPGRFLNIIFTVLISTIIFAGCEKAPAATFTATPVTPSATATSDPCAPGQIKEEVQKVNRHMREFDDEAMLASTVQGEQLMNSISSLQRIRREADGTLVPVCLTKLKTYQIQHMNSVINTLVAFTSGGDQQIIDQGIQLARQQHDRYTLELARLLGLTVVPVPAVAIGTPPETPAP